MLKEPYPFKEGKHYYITDNNCWQWKGYTNDKGYGRVYRSGSHVLAHRISYEWHHGPLGELYCCHKCDNPGCINPEHLFAGTHADNLRDMASKGKKKKFTTAALMLYGRLNPGWTYRQAAKFFGVSNPSIHQRVKENPDIDFGR